MNNPQLTFHFKLRDDATFNNFYEGDNVAVVETLKKSLAGETESFIYLWGNEGVGRTHLLQACCHAVSETQSVVYFDLNDYEQLSPDIFTGLDQIFLVCLDNINGVLGRKDWEEALFHFYNRARDKQCHLIVSGNTAPMQLACQLADLKSRLSWGLIFQVKALNDQQKISALIMRAEKRGLILSENTAQFILNHMPRNLTQLFKILETLERASLVEQRRITIPFVKTILGIH